jgi:hypothetical protein
MMVLKSTKELIEESSWKVVAFWEVNDGRNMVKSGLKLIEKGCDGKREICKKVDSFSVSMLSPLQSDHHVYL